MLCVDYRALNKAMENNRYPLPLISEMLDRTSGIPMTSSESRKATSTNPLYGQFKHRFMPIGLTNAPATLLQSYNTEERR